jgi:hypothetical protein
VVLRHLFVALVFVKYETGLSLLMTAAVGVHMRLVRVKPVFVFCHVQPHLGSYENSRLRMDKVVPYL